MLRRIDTRPEVVKAEAGYPSCQPLFTHNATMPGDLRRMTAGPMFINAGGVGGCAYSQG